MLFTNKKEIETKIVYMQPNQMQILRFLSSLSHKPVQRSSLSAPS